ncbi:unnamed protein product [Tilletia laevis]|nr:hypothetical protein CF336_g4146 [Tilletia laevis]CAD6887022.1 unnamed protein product [Tilletia caries]CAD6944898.1 unnamed protein product [Tilletia controversa]CAD6903556.1 unnamed protein product [Tilletia caries]CAD6907330.1 unnamed protein product [Tilletia laevis]
MADVDQVESGSAGGEVVSFPDISGLRATAPTRKDRSASKAVPGAQGSQSDVVQVLQTELDIAELSQLFSRGTNPQSKDDSILRALSLAWAISLYHIQSHEASTFAFSQLRGVSATTALVRQDLRFTIDRSQPPALSIAELQALLDASAQHDAPYTADTAVIHLSSAADGLHALQFSVLVVARAENSRLVLEIHASSTVHSVESALFQLRQLESLLRSFLPGSDKAELPALTSERFPPEFLAIDNPNFQILEEDIGPAGLAEERLEHQFERRVVDHPDAPALDFRYYIADKSDVPEENVLLSYKDLDELANSIAHALSDAGAVRTRDELSGDHIVALFLPKSPETFITILGVCKANASWCPLDVEWPIERQAALFKKCKARYIITSTDLDDKKLAGMDLGDVTILRADRIVAEARRDSSRRKPLEIRRSRADQLAYLVWTSGTTGLPKAVGVQHSAVVQAIRALQKVVPHDPPVRYLQFSEYTFDLSIMDEFWTWGLGGTVCSGSRALHLDSLTAIGNATRTTHVILTPAVSAEIRREDVPSMKVLINGGEKLSQVVADEWSRNCCLLNLYGPAEATLIAMNRRVPEGDVFKAPNIGVALPTTSLALLDKHGNIVPRGAIGELAIGGPQVARGYVGDPAKTAEKFVDHPFLGRAYRTGDLTRQLWSGEIEYLGREDDQVKINGVRIELLEINAAIKDCHDDVKDSDTMALPRPNNPESLQIVNFSVIPRRAGDPDKSVVRTDPEAAKIAYALRAAALLRLPSNMVPTHFLILSRFPKTSSAKIDRVAIKKALQNFDYMRWESKIASDGDDEDEDDDGLSEGELIATLASAISSVYGVDADSTKAKELLRLLAKSKLQVGAQGESKKKASAAPESAAESLVRKLLGEVCGIEAQSIGRNTPLPALGLTSFKAMSLTRKLMEAGVKCSVLSIIQHNTMSKLSTFISSNSSYLGPDTQPNGSEHAPDGHGPTVNGIRTEAVKTNEVLKKFSDAFRPSVSKHLRMAEDEIVSVLPCAPLQEGMLVETQRHGSYWAFRKYELSGKELKLGKLVEALRELVRVVEIFRTGFLEASSLDVEADSALLLPFQPNFVQVVTKRNDAFIEQLEVPESADFDAYIQDRASKAISHNAISGRAPVAFWATQQGSNFRLVIHAHHGTYDGQTLSIMQDLLRQFYLGEQPSSDFSQYEQALPHLLPLSKDAMTQQQLRWKKALSSYAHGPETRFPDVRDEKDLSDSTSLVTATQNAKTTWQVLEEASMRLECSPRIIAQVAWARLLAAYSEQDDVLIGESVTGRDKDPALMDVMGAIITTVPVPISFGKGKTFASVVERTKTFHDEVQQDQHAPLSLVRTELQIPTDRPVLGALFVFNSAPAEQTHNDEIMFGAPLDFGASVEHDIALQLNLLSDQSLEIEISTMRTRMSLVQLDVLAQQYDSLLFGICKDPSTDTGIVPFFPDSLQSISAVTPWARAGNNTGKNSASWLSYWAEKQPDSPALEFHPEVEGNPTPLTMSFAQLDQASDRLAALLHSRIGTQQMVAVCLRRQPGTYVALLAILKSSNVYLPIDDALPDERKRLLLQISGARHLIVDESNKDVFTDMQNATIVHADTDWDALAQGLPPAPTPTQMADALAFCIYTSGSTGQPKGCLLTAGNLSTAIEAFLDVIESKAPGSFQGSARYLARSAEAFDVHLKEVLLAIRTGACIVTAPREVILQDLGVAMKALRPTHAAVVPSLFFTAGKHILPADLPSLCVLIVGGEKVTSDIISTWGAQEKVVVLNAYGPTEVTIGISIAQISQASLPSNVGRAFPGSQYWVMQETEGKLKPVMRGQVGELCVSGPQVGLGYLGQESKAFFTWQGQRMYRTGDLARMSVNDEVHYAGRADSSQVKVRGARLELGEVDAKLEELAGPRTSASTVLTSHPELKDERLVSFVQRDGVTTRSDDATIEEDSFDFTRQLATKARQALPAHMAPFLVVPVTAIPLAVISGKSNHRALVKLYQSCSLSELRQKLAPSARRDLDETEAIIAEETKRTFGVDFELTPATNLFETGMDSLSAIRLCSRLRKRGLNIAVGALMAGATIEAIAASADEKRQSGSSNQRSASDFDKLCEELSAKIGDDIRSRAEAVLPCMPLQSSLISLSQVRPEEQLYVGKFELNLFDGVSVEQLKAACFESLEAHEIYRTIFPTAGKTLAQVVLRNFAADDVWEAATTSSEEDKSSLLAKYSMALISNLGSRPPVRLVHFAKLNKLVLLLHHAIYDGESVNNLLSEISDRYTGHQVTSTDHFRDVVRSWFLAEPTDAEHFWTEYLDGFSYSPFPNLTGVRASGVANRNVVELRSRVSFQSVKKIAQKHAVSPQSLLLSVFSRLYGMFTGEDDVLFGLVLRGRSFNVATIDNIQGPCVTTVPFFAKSVSQDLDQLTKEVQSRTSRLLSYQHQSLSKVAKIVQVQGSLFNTLFAFTTNEAGQLSFCHRPEVSMDAEFDLAVEVEAHPSTGEINLLATYRDSIMSPDQAQILLKALDSLLEAVGAPATSAQPELEILSVVNNPPKVPEGSKASFVSRFQEHARKDGSKTAFVFGESFDNLTSVSYSELDEMSSTLAKNIFQQSASIVAVFMHKSVDFYAVLLAVWKAGKTYLPVDPSLPSERVRYMLDTAGDVVVCTTSELRRSLPDIAGTTLTVEDLKTKSVPDDALPAPNMDSAAYLLFTSGSTGRPKGCLVSQRALAAALLSWDTIIPLSPSARMLQLASIGFDVSLIEITMPLARGASFASAPKEVLLDDLEDTFHKLAITCADLPAALASALQRSSVPKLEWLMTGGDMMSEDTLKEWAPHGQLINAWGPTETTIGNTLGFMPPNATRNNIGKVYPCSSIYVLDRERRAVFKGSIGELAVGGPQVGDGYIGQAELTQQRFISLEDGTRVYLTGDRGRLLSDGSVEFIGRAEQGQVKVNGQRIELDEISSAFTKIEKVSDAETLYLQHPSFVSKQLVTFVCIGSATQLSSSIQLDESEAAVVTVRKALQDARRHLAAYMIPAHIIVLGGRLPLTHNNKTDRKALQAFYESLSAKDIRSFGGKLSAVDGVNESWTQRGSKLRDAVAEFCDMRPDDISTSTSLYHLGVDSISAMILSKRLGLLGFAVTVQDILQTPTLYALAHKIDTSSAAAQVVDANALERLVKETQTGLDLAELRVGSSDLVIPCSPLQAGMLAQFVTTEGKAYLHQHIFKTKLSFEHIQVTWNKIVERTDILRTTFHFITPKTKSTGTWYQAVRAQLQPAVSRTSSANGNEHLPVSMGQEEDFLSLGPHKLEVEALHDGSSRITFTLHHALYDGNSLPMLFHDFDVVSKQEQVSTRPPFAQLLPHLLSADEDVAYWAKELQEFSPRVLCQSTLEASSSAEVQHELELDVETAKAGCQRLGVSLQVAASLAFAKLLASLTGSSDVVFGEIFALRYSLPDADSIIGPAFNTVPVRVALTDAERTVTEQLQVLQRKNDEGRTHRKASLRDVIAAVARQGVQGSLFDALFDFASQQEESPQYSNLTPISAPDADAFGQYSLNVGFVQTSERLFINITARSELIKAHPLHELASQYEAILVNLLEKADEPVTSMPDGSKLAPTHSSRSAQANQTANGTHGTNGTDRWRTSREEVVWRAIARAASIEPDELSRDTSLASLGLDSISTIGISSTLRKDGIRLSAAQILRGATLGRILDHLATANGHVTKPAQNGAGNGNGNGHHKAFAVSKSEVASRLGVKEAHIEQVLPVLSGQAWMIGLWLRSGRRQGVFSFPVRLPAKLDEERLRQSWRQLLQRHECLRTTFASVKGSPVQVVYTATSQVNEIQSVSVADDQDVRGAVTELIAKQSQVAEDFYQPPVTLFAVRGKDPASEGALMLRLFHGLYDAVSLDLIVSDLAALYDGQAQNDKAPTFGRLVQAIDSAAEEISHSESGKTFWSKALRGANKTLIRGRPEGSPAQRPPFVFEKSAFQGVRKAQALLNSKRADRPDADGLSLQTLFIAAVADTIGAKESLANPALMLLHAGRTSASTLLDHQLGETAGEIDVDRVVAPTAALTPLCVRREESGHTTDSAGSGRALVEAAQKVATDLLARVEHEQTRLGDIYASAGISDDGPLTNVMLNLVWFARGKTATSTATSNGGGPANDAWTHFKVGEAVEFEAVDGLPASRHALDDLDLGSPGGRFGFDRMEVGLSIDVALDEGADAVGIAVLSNNGGVDEAAARGLVSDIVSRVQIALASL